MREECINGILPPPRKLILNVLKSLLSSVSNLIPSSRSLIVIRIRLLFFAELDATSSISAVRYSIAAARQTGDVEEIIIFEYPN